jgi:hypothetical protein
MTRRQDRLRIVDEPENIPLGVSQAIKEELAKPGGLALALAGLAASLVTVFVLPEWKVPAAWPVTLAVVFIAAIWIVTSALRQCVERATSLAKRRVTYLPKVVHAMLTPGQEDELILLLEANRLFGQFMLVSIYYDDERGFEVLVGSGEVGNVQSNGAIQIVVSGWEEPYQHLRRAVIEQTLGTLPRLLVRPAPAAAPGMGALAVYELLSRNETLRRPGNG